MQNIEFINPELRDELEQRINRIRKAMGHQELDALLIAGSPNMLYTSGRVFRGHVFIPRDGEAIYFVSRPVGFTDPQVVYVRKPEQIADYLTEHGFGIPLSVGLECDELAYNEVIRLSKVFNGSELKNCSPLMRSLRMIKSPFEIRQMKRDGVHMATVYHRVPHLYKEDMTDLELQVEIERTLRLEGCLGYPRTAGHLMEINLGSVLYGANADAPSPYDFALGGAGTDPSLPVGANGSIMHSGHTVMIDMNGGFNGYQSDMTRVWRIGEIPDIAYKAHEASRRILRELEKTAKPGVEISELCRIADAIVADERLEAYFMGHTQKAGFIGHGVGIELNEQPVIMGRNRSRLEENMTIALEPKFALPEIGAVGVENTYRVAPDGLECLTIFPEEIGELI